MKPLYPKIKLLAAGLICLFIFSSFNHVSPKVMVCHNGNTITVSEISARKHFLHGDRMGECSPMFPKKTEIINE